MAATNEYLKRRAEYSVAHTEVLVTTVSHYGPFHKDKIIRWAKSTLTKAEVSTKNFSSRSCRS